MKSAPKKKPRFFTKLDALLLLIAFTVLLLGGILLKFVLQKDTYVTVELLASGGEWWWGTSPPFYWNINPLQKGAVEWDVFDKPLVELLDVVTYDQDNRKFVWIKAKLKARKNVLKKTYSFKYTDLQIGKMITISPNNISVIAQVVGIEGVGQLGKQETRTITARIYELRQWQVDNILVGDVVRNSKGEIVAEILDKSVEPTEVVTTTWLGEPLLKRDPLTKDVTLKIRLTVQRENNEDYYMFYQLVKRGLSVQLQLQNTVIEPYILDIKPSEEPGQ